MLLSPQELWRFYPKILSIAHSHNGNVTKLTINPYPTIAAARRGAKPAAIANAPAVIIEGIADSKTAVLRTKVSM